MFDAPGQPLRLERFPLPELAPGEVLAEVLCCTLCGSDLHTLAGRRNEPTPTILGHEIVGLVDGKRVTWPMVVNGHKYGHALLTTSTAPYGGLSSHCLLTADTPIFPVPDHIPTPLAATLNCAFATAQAMIRHAPAVEGKVVVVLGLGLVGLAVATMCLAAGARAVWGVDASPSRLATAASFGITKPNEATVDLIFDASGSPPLIAEWCARLARAGAAILAGAVFPAGPLTLDLEQLVRRSITLRGVYNYETIDLEHAIAFVATHCDRFPFAGLIAGPFPLNQIDDAISLAHSGQFHRVAITPQGFA